MVRKKKKKKKTLTTAEFKEAGKEKKKKRQFTAKQNQKSACSCRSRLTCPVRQPTSKLSPALSESLEFFLGIQ